MNPFQRWAITKRSGALLCTIMFRTRKEAKGWWGYRNRENTPLVRVEIREVQPKKRKVGHVD